MIDKTKFRNVLTYSAGCQNAFDRTMAECGYKPLTTYFGDFSIAEWMSGEKGVRDTYERAIKEHKSDYMWLTEICMVLNHKCWQHTKGSVADELGVFYAKLYYEMRDMLLGEVDEDGNVSAGLLDEEGKEYFYRVTD